MTPKQKAYIMAMNRDGLSIEEIAEAKTEQIEKEPASVGADTDSASDNTMKKTASQALESAERKLLAIYETLTPEETRAWELGEVYAEIVRGIVWGCVE